MKIQPLIRGGCQRRPHCGGGSLSLLFVQAERASFFSG
jgi:hypothetical protein